MAKSDSLKIYCGIILLLILINNFCSCRIPHYNGKVWAGLHRLKDITSTSGKKSERQFEKKDVDLYDSNYTYFELKCRLM